MTRRGASNGTLAVVTKGGRCAERLAASLALLMLVVAAAELLTGAIRNWTAVLIALAGFVVATVASWYVVSRHGIARWLGLIVVAGSAIPLGWSIHVADLRPARLASAVACIAIAVWCARMALRRSGQAPSEAAPVTPHAAHPVLIINPGSGGGKAIRLDLVAECKARGIEPVVLRPGCDLPGLAEAAIADGADIIGMAGGDGSQAVIAQIAAAHNIPHVVVPAGTRNHFALDLGIDRDDVIGSFTALEAIGQVRRFTGWLEWTTRRFEVRSGGSVEIGIDGEAMVLDPPLVFVSRRGALRVRIPRSAGRSTAVRVNSRSTVAELVALAIGRKRKEAAVDRYHAQPLGR